MARRWWKWLLAVAAILLLVLGWDRVQGIHWVGSTDLEIQFVVTEAGSNKPVPGARVEVKSEGGLYDERDSHDFTLSTDPDGVARKECRNSMCSGTRSGLRFTDTYNVSLPWWRFRVTAAGYQPSQWVALTVPKYWSQVRRAGPRRAELVVQVLLHKSRPQPSAAPDPAARSTGQVSSVVIPLPKSNRRMCNLKGKQF